MKHRIWVLFFLCLGKSFSQQMALKEQYDVLHHNIDFDNGMGVIQYIENINSLLGARYGDNYGYVMESYIRLYNTTKDKAYLIKFINMAIDAINHRFSGEHQVGWVENPEVSTTLYQNGFVVWPMAHFVHLVDLEEPSLYSTPLPQSLLITPIQYPQSFPTYGNFAEWIEDRIIETLDAHVFYFWIGCIDDVNCTGGFAQGIDKESAAAINQQSGFAAAMLYLGHVYNNSYLERAARIAQLWKSIIDIADPCQSLCTSTLSYVAPLLRINANNNNSYWWYTDGWRIESRVCCSIDVKYPFVNKYTNGYEDMSHAAQALVFPLAANAINLTTGGNPIFTETDMIRFRNTFTKNIFDGSNNFYNTVIGSDDQMKTDDNCAPNSCPHGYFKYNATEYMPFYKFDEADNTAIQPNVYDIILNFYQSDVYNNPVNGQTGGQTYYGLGETISAQWDIDCPNLTLYNRDVVYNQNFFAKGELTIAPNQTTDANYTATSFAEPIITTQEFTVEPQVEANFVSGKRIVIKKGHIKQGARSRGYIDPTLSDECGTGKSARMAGGGDDDNNKHKGGTKGNNETEAEEAQTASTNKSQVSISKSKIPTQNSKTVSEPPTPKSQLISIVPNPSASGIFTISSQQSAIGSVTVTNVLGEIIYKSQVLNQIQIDISKQPKGIYFVQVTTPLSNGEGAGLPARQAGVRSEVRKIVYQ